MNKSAFVTGGTGFIGINLIKQLIERNWQVTALHRASSDISKLEELPVKLVEGSITDLESLHEVFPSDITVVFHLAGNTNMWSQHNEYQTKVNVQGTRNMVTAAIKHDVKTFIHTSSVSAWGTMGGIVTEESPQGGGESWVNYERTKWLSEREALKARNHNIKVVIMNPAMVVGPYDANNWGRLFFALRDDDLPGVTCGNMSIAHVNEVVRAHISAVENGRDGENYILGGQNCTFAEFVSIIADVSNISSQPKIIPAPILKLVANFKSAIAYFTGKEPDLTPELAKLMTRNVVYSSDKAKEELGYRIPPVRESVRDCYKWLVQEELL